jgi:hypothetical protein
VPGQDPDGDDATAVVHRGDDRVGDGARGQPVLSGGERRGAAGGDRVDPSLQFDPVGVGEARPPVGRVAGGASSVQVADDAYGVGQCERAAVTDDLASDVVAVPCVEEHFDGGQRAVDRTQQDHLGIP